MSAYGITLQHYLQKVLRSFSAGVVKMQGGLFVWQLACVCNRHHAMDSQELWLTCN